MDRDLEQLFPIYEAYNRYKIKTEYPYGYHGKPVVCTTYNVKLS